MNTKLSGKSDTHSHPYLNTANVANNLTTTSAGYALDARQGKALNDEIASKASIGADVRFGGIHIGNGEQYIYPEGDGNIWIRYGTSGSPKYISLNDIQTGIQKTHVELQATTINDTDVGPFWLPGGSYLLFFNGVCDIYGTGATKNTNFAIYDYTTGYAVTVYRGIIVGGGEQFCNMCAHLWISGTDQSHQIGIKVRLDNNDSLTPKSIKGTLSYVKFI